MYLIALEDFYKGKFFQHVDFHKNKNKNKTTKAKPKTELPTGTQREE